MASSNTDYAEPAYAQNLDKSKAPYYTENLDPRITPELKDLLENYSHISRDQQSAHIHRIRDLAWQIRQYPCTGSGGWLKPLLRVHPLYDSEILPIAKKGGTVVDIGTFVGHDLRRLVFDGAPSEHLWGVDIVSHFDVSYELFNDREKWKGKFVEADFLRIESNELKPLLGKTDVIIISQVLHQWVWERQLKAAKALVALSKAGTLVVGTQMGQKVAGEIVPDGFTVPLYVQSPESWQRLWDEAGEATGTRWECQSWLRKWEHVGVESMGKETAFMGPKVGILEFVARRLE